MNMSIADAWGLYGKRRFMKARMKTMINVVRRRSSQGYKRCAFTGYRTQKLPFGFNEADTACVVLKAELRRRIEDLIGQGYAHFISGGGLWAWT